MGFFDGFIKKIRPKDNSAEVKDDFYEYCPNCYANLTLQKGYDPSLDHWTCKGCGEVLINPGSDWGDVIWICDECGAVMNGQPGFSEDCGEWTCTQCGFVNMIDQSQVFISEGEYLSEKSNPYRGLSNEDVLQLSMYRDEEYVDGRSDIAVVRNCENGKRYIRKLLKTYDRSIYEHLREHPVNHMPGIIAFFESSNCLIVIEEYIEGRTLEDILEEAPLAEDRAAGIAKDICTILNELHSLPKPIVHRDIKPSNIIITPTGEAFLLDMNVAKWYDPDKTDDTRHMGTQYYAAPEQAGYGLSASSGKTDVYAVGILLNVMVTGCFPKEKRVMGALWPVIERCISLEAGKRYSAKELMAVLEDFERDRQ